MSSIEPVWIIRAQRGDEEAFCQLIETTQKPVFNLCYRMLGVETEAEDAAQETFLRAYTNLRRYDPKRPFMTWLLSIAAHYCIDQIRKRRTPVTPLEDLPEEVMPDTDSPSPEATFFTAENQRQVRKLLNILDPQDRAAIVMRYWYDFSDQEIGEALSLTVPAVKSRLHRARGTLARQWAEAIPLTH